MRGEIVIGLLSFFMMLTNFTIFAEAQSIEPRAKKPLYKFKFAWTNSSDAEARTGEVGYKAEGYMRSFGNISGGGGFNYDADPDGQSYGGGFNVGTSDEETNKPINGIGGGYSFNETNLDVGAGISAFDQKVNFQLDIATSGEILIHFDLIGSSANLLNCQPINSTDTANDTAGMTCTVKPKS